jgi:hypothetical protein
MKIGITIEWVLKDKDGKTISKTKSKSNSLLKAFADILYSSMAATNLAAVYDIGNTSQTIFNTSYPMYAFWTVVSAIGNTSIGIVVGTGSNAVTLTDHALQTLIAHGNGSGQLYYSANSVITPITSGGTRSFQIQRTFTNNSGSDITINEIGLYMQFMNSGNGYCYFCIDRTLNTKTLSNATTGTVTYKISITV